MRFEPASPNTSRANKQGRNDDLIARKLWRHVILAVAMHHPKQPNRGDREREVYALVDNRGLKTSVTDVDSDPLPQRYRFESPCLGSTRAAHRL